MHASVSHNPYFPGDLIGFTTGLLITVLLLVLTLRAAKLPGTPVANIVFAVCCLLWNAGGLMYTTLLASGLGHSFGIVFIAQAIHLTGAAAFPLPVLAIWRPFATLPWQRAATRVLYLIAGFATALITVFLWSAPGHGNALMPVLPYYVAALLVFGFALSLKRRSTPRGVYLPSLAVVTTMSATAVTLTASHRWPNDTALGFMMAVLGSHLVLLVFLCSFLLFARFRYADIFLRYSVRILLAGIWAASIAMLIHSPPLFQVNAHAAPEALHAFLVIILANALLLSFTFVDERISRLLNRWLFHSSDYRAAGRALGDRLRKLHVEPEIGAAVEDAARRPLELSGVQLVGVDSMPQPAWPMGILEGELVELDFEDPLRQRLPLANTEVMLPVASGGRVSHVLLVSPGPARPGFVVQDLEYLRRVAAQCGQRFDALIREREAVERQSRESLLLQQVTEAELRALRAQINPHFLFNSLNTIADLIVRDPVKAEAMTLRLASVFRHVLAHSSRPLTSIRDEVQFLRTYLYIEEARFGDRLTVDIDVSAEIAGEAIPSLILQPVVENALKHGIGPKPGPGRLWISAHRQGTQVRLRVEDDGMGPGRSTSLGGLGLTNISERLSTLYQDRASVKLEAREGGGSRVTVLIPL